MAVKRKTKSKSKRKTKAQIRAQNQLFAVMLCTMGLLFIFLAFVRGTAGWLTAHNVMLGLFGPSAFFIGPVFVYISIMSSFDKLGDDLPLRAALTGVMLGLIAAACQIFMAGPTAAVTLFDKWRAFYLGGQSLSGGGVIGALFGAPLMLLGAPGDRIAVCLLLFLLLMIITKSTIAGILRAAKRPVAKLAGSMSELASACESFACETSRTAIDISLDDQPAKFRKKAVEPQTQTNSKKQKLLDTLNDVTPARPTCVPNPEPIVPASVVSPTLEPTPESADTSHHAPYIDDIIERMSQEQPTLPKQETSPEDNTSEETAGIPGDLTDMADSATIAPDVLDDLPTSPRPEPPEYVCPPVTLLGEPKPGVGVIDNEELRQNAQRLVDTLQSFGVQTRVTDICRGPAVTRYELQPSAGVKISKITSLADDIALNLAAAGVRIEAPIPNKAAVGIEVPNRIVSPVTLREVIDSDSFANAKSRVAVALGRDISGNVVVADIAKMPHLLIAGATGSGKSVCINSIIMSILYKARPDEVKLMLVDPKVVELGVYNGLPHLVVPVVNDPKKAAGVLGWAVTEMLNRYKIFAASGARDIASFNRLAVAQDALEPMCHIVIIIDELADLMMAAPTEAEDSICRLAQMARAAGMHLIIATQRPSVDVITGIIKANIPSRIAFAVSSQVDSRTILDMGGAEKLLGAGDMLFYPVGAAKPVRVQGCFVSDEEIERVTNFIKSAGTPEYDQHVLEEIDRQTPAGKGNGGTNASGGDAGDEDVMLQDAIECVIDAGVASTSLLQRRLKLGYARAARIVDDLESRGIVGPFEGSKPRQVLISRERWIEMKMNRGN